MFKKDIIWLALILVLAFSIRYYGITSSPNGLNIDEASIGYNAWSILTTGKDEHGDSLPIFFKAFGEYKLPIYIYSVALSQFILGSNDLSVRLPAVIYGVGSILFFYLLTRSLFIDFFTKKEARIGSLVGSFLFATSSWHIQFSRVGFEASAAIFFLIVGLYLFWEAKQQEKLKLLVLSFMSFALSLYSYNSARIVIPIVLLSLFLAYRRNIPLKKWLAALGFVIIITTPFIAFILSPEGWTRAKDVVIFYNFSHFNDVKLFIVNYWQNISPWYIFIKGDPVLAHGTSHRMSFSYY